MLDPDEVNARAFADQRRRLEALGGEAAVRARGDFGDESAYTPPPELRLGPIRSQDVPGAGARVGT